MNQKVKNLIQKLGEAIHESVSESEDIAGVVKNIREQGFDVLLMLEATIGLNEVEAGSRRIRRIRRMRPKMGPSPSSDLTFLKSLRISLTEENSRRQTAAPPRHRKSCPSVKPDALKPSHR